MPLLLIEINVVVSYDSYYLRELQFNEANKTTIAVLTTTVRVMDLRKTMHVQCCSVCIPKFVSGSSTINKSVCYILKIEFGLTQTKTSL